MTQDSFAVRVKNVSKMYHLWNSPRARLLAPINRLMDLCVPSQRGKREQNGQGYREFYALNNLSFDIRKGESWGFVGVNGSGKSTLLKIIAGNLRPSSGIVEVDGKVVILDYGSGFNGDFTGKENIYIKATLLGLTRKQINQRYHSIVEFAELGDFIHQPVKTYSSGMVSRLGFAMMAHVDADIIITDEALAVGDVFFVQKCMNYIRDFLKKGTFLFVSHSINDVISLCKNAVWLEKGNLKAIGPAAKVAHAYLNKSQLENQLFDPETVIENKNLNTEIILSPTINSERKNSKAPIDLRQQYQDHAVENISQDIPIFDTSGTKDQGGATISRVVLTDEEGRSISQIIGGELVTLTIDVVAEHELKSPLVCFQVLDRLGQIIFSDSTYLMTSQKSLNVDAGAIFTVKFSYHMPLLPTGDYVIRVIVATKAQDGEMTILKTANNTLAFHSVTTGARHGFIGIPMHSIKLKCYSNTLTDAGILV